jgi:glycosyltransferase involved in cell wall biosynthesis
MRASVIVPAHDAAATLGRTLAALAGQDLAEEFEVIVVDDGSADSTAEIAADAGVRLVRHPRPLGPAAARNSGAAGAAGDVLAFTDSDCYPTPGWLRNALAAAAEADLVQGAVRPDPAVEPEPFDRTVWVVAEVGLYETANLIVRRDWFERVGGFEDWLGARVGKPLAEDVWLGWRLRRAGARTAFSEAALVHHEVFRRDPAEYVAERARVTYFPDIVEKVPELRRELLFARTFLNRRTAAFDLAVSGAVAARLLQSRAPLAAAAPYAVMLARGARRWGRRAPAVAVAELAADALGLGALLLGTARRRSPVL